MIATLLVFLGVSALVICTPGPDTALTIRGTLGGGRRHGVLTAAGVASGQLVWTVAAAVGIAGLLSASRPAFEALRFAGATYLVVLGVHSVWSAWRRRADDDQSADGSDDGPGGGSDAAAPALRRPSGRRAYLLGVVNDLSNPKMAVFFLSLLPQFAPGGSVAAYIGLGAVFGVLTFLWLSAYAVLFDRARRLFARSAVRRRLDTLTGVVLVGLGVRVAVEG